MENISVRQRLRPVRYLFIIPSDAEALLRAAALNTIVWGGIYNPIVVRTAPLDGYIREFDPDYLVNLTGESLGEPFETTFRFRILTDADLVRDLEAGDPRRRKLKVGLGIELVLRHIKDMELRDAAAESRVAIPVDVPEDWRLYSAASFGAFSSLPNLVGDFAALFRALTRAHDVQVNPAAAMDVRQWLFPIDVTGYGIKRMGSAANVSSHVVYVGDPQNVDDLTGFWNLRATGRELWFMPASHYEHHRSMLEDVLKRGKYAINPHVENRADIQKAPSISEEAFLAVAEWIRSLGFAPAAVRTWQPRYGYAAEYYVGDIHAADLEAARGSEVSILADERMTPVKLVEPPYLDDDDASMEHEWAVELQVSNPYSAEEWMCTLPSAPGAEALVRRMLIGGRSDTTRLGRNGFVVTEEHLQSTVSFLPVRTAAVFKALLEAATGYEANPSQPGIYADRIIRRMGLLPYDCRIFKLRGVRDVIDRLSGGATLTKGNMYQIVTSMTPDAFGQNWRPDLYDNLFISRGHGQQKLEFSVIFSELLEKRIIRPGLDFTCKNCQKRDWHHVSEFSEEYICRFCFEKQRVPFSSSAEWQYRADGLFQINKSAQGSIATILALWRLNQLSHGAEGRYCTGMNLCKAGGVVDVEIDYCYLQMRPFTSSYEFVLGEAKNFFDYDAHAIDRLMALADQFGQKPFLAVATLKDAFTDAEKEILRATSKKGYRMIPLTRLELDPYDLHKRFEGTRHKYAVSLRDLSEACVAVNLA